MPIFHLCISDKRELSDLNSEKKIMNEMKVKSNILREKNSKHLPWLDAEDLSFAFLVQNGLGCQFQLTWKLSIFVLKIEFSIFLHISHKYTTKEALLFHTNRKYKKMVRKNTL